MREEVLEPVSHRHLVLTMPRLLRGIFRKRRELLLDLSQCSAEAIAEYMRTQLGAELRPGIVVSIATSGDMLQWHPHGHLLVTDGAFSDDGTFHPLATWDMDTLMRLFRERLLARLVDKHAISQELAKRLMSWTHPGFSAHVGEPIAADNTQALENVAGYAVRNPLSLQRLVYLDGQQAVIYKGLKHNPTLGRNFETMDPLEWLARMADHIPDPGRHGAHRPPPRPARRRRGPGRQAQRDSLRDVEGRLGVRPCQAQACAAQQGRAGGLRTQRREPCVTLS